MPWAVIWQIIQWLNIDEMGLIEPLFLSNTLLEANISDPWDDFLNTHGTLGTFTTTWWHQDAPMLVTWEGGNSPGGRLALLSGEIRERGNSVRVRCAALGKDVKTGSNADCTFKFGDPNCTFLIKFWERKRGKMSLKVKYKRQVSLDFIKRNLQRLDLCI